MLILIDNYDSFTYNLYHYIRECHAEVEVHRNDTISVADVIAQKPEAIVLSPGPCTPNEAGICLDLVEAAAKHNIPLLGVCLGHQSIGQAYGANIIRGEKPMHAKITTMHHLEKSKLFNNIPKDFKATRYHSLIVEKDTLPECFNITATSDDGVIQAMEHKTLPLFGVQFHPESIASEYGHTLIENFLTIANVQGRG